MGNLPPGMAPEDLDKSQGIKTGTELSDEHKTKAQAVMGELVAYVPDDAPNKEHYIKLVNEQVLGHDKQGKPRHQSDLIYFLQVCRATGLNPLSKQIYAVYRWSKRAGKEVMVIQVGIDGLRSVAERTKLYAGSDAGEIEMREDGNPVMATVTVYKLNSITGERMPTTASARWSEYAPNPLSDFWVRMPTNQLEKCAEAKALRKAFPNTAQLYIQEEVERTEHAESIDGGVIEGIEGKVKSAKSKEELLSILKSLSVEDRKRFATLIEDKLGELV